MEGDISAARIANAICQDTTFSGVHLLVEGKLDFKLYSKFAQKDSVRVKIALGKYRLRQVYSLLMERGMDSIVGIRDADFLRIKDNPKYSSSFSESIFPTDCHDAEIMIVSCGILDDLLALVCDPENIDNFVTKHRPLLALITDAIYPIGCLRLANKQFGLGLSFKPERPEGNQLKVRKFVVESMWKSDVKAMINTVWEFSQNRGLQVASKDVIADKLHIVMGESHPVQDISNGHDFAAVFHLVLTKGLKSSNRLLQDSGCVQDLLIAHYDLKRFALTTLYRSVQEWAATNGKPSVFHSP
jgi:hypothetical protein